MVHAAKTDFSGFAANICETMGSDAEIHWTLCLKYLLRSDLAHDRYHMILITFDSPRKDLLLEKKHPLVRHAMQKRSAKRARNFFATFLGCIEQFLITSHD